MIGEPYLLVAVVGVVFSTGILVHKVNNHARWIGKIDNKVDKHSENVASINTSVKDMTGDIIEIKADVKTLLRNGKK